MYSNDKLKELWQENPISVILVGSLAASAAAKLITAISSAQSRRAYSKMVKYRIGR